MPNNFKWGNSAKIARQKQIKKGKVINRQRRPSKALNKILKKRLPR
ncbi:MAG: hypothetical protein WC480_00795 [Patescibacteria group bacterium]